VVPTFNLPEALGYAAFNYVERSSVGKVLLGLHVLAAIVAIGPVTVAASMFPRHARALAASAGAAGAAGDGAAERELATLRTLRRITRVYAVVGLAVPAFGVGVATELGVLTETWLLVSIALTALAALVLVVRVLPGQDAVLAAAPTPAAREVRALAAATGVFSLLWAVVVVLMIVRPGSTTGV
jgi:hypothetical protein